MDNMPSTGMLSGPIEGTLLQFLVWATGAKRVLEIGCFIGFSAQMMASALPEDGTLTTCEIDPDVAAIAQSHLDGSPDGHKIDIRIGPALETLRSAARAAANPRRLHADPQARLRGLARSS